MKCGFHRRSRNGNKEEENIGVIYHALLMSVFLAVLLGLPSNYNSFFEYNHVRFSVQLLTYKYITTEKNAAKAKVKSDLML